MTTSLTIAEHAAHLIPRLKRDRRIPVWPADVFGVCAALLVHSGSYCNVLNWWPPRKYHSKNDPELWARRAQRWGRSWRRSWVQRRQAPARIAGLWRSVMQAGATPIQYLGRNPVLSQQFMELCGIADEACEGVGSPLGGDESEIDEQFLYHASSLLLRKLPGSSVCQEIDTSRLRVLPKMHTPQNGLTIRSLSLYVCLCTPGEVAPEWIEPHHPLEDNGLNLLVVPWPAEVFPAQFQAAEPLRGEVKNMPPHYGLFTFEHREAGPITEHIKPLYEAAQTEVGRVDGVVLPEMALSETEHDELCGYLLDQGSFLVSGVGRKSEAPRSRGQNMVCLDLPFTEPARQRKHHRWKLESSQISQYGLGSLLDPEIEWWEHIDLEDRCFLFAPIRRDMLLSVLICEDLARPDPVGDLVRAVGPNLVIALLMDGPQLKSRWAARYATTLADDPGCSVLSVTSLGMSTLSRPRSGENRSRVVALWKDAKSSETQEIELTPGAGAVVLSLSMRHVAEWSADGRTDGGAAVYPVLSGVRCVGGKSDVVRSAGLAVS